MGDGIAQGAKRQGRFLDRSEAIRAKSISRMILLAQFSCEPPCQSQFAHSRSMALIQFWLIFLSRGDCPISRDNNISQSRMRREERQRSDCEWQGRLKKNEARSGNERASGNERFSARGSLSGRENGFALSCFDGRLASFRVARHARFRDGCAGIPPRGGGGERDGDAGEGVAFKARRRRHSRQSRKCAMPAHPVRGKQKPPNRDR